MNYNFSGKRALITGAGRGLGRDLCFLLSKLGAEVIAISKDERGLISLKQEGGCSTYIAANLADANEARQAAEKAGDIDLLVNNAGVAALDHFLDVKVEDFDLLVNVNVRAVMVISQVIAKNMISRGVKGSIVNVSSQASSTALPLHATYCATKGALDQMTRVMALELGKYGIRANCINPTVVLTEMGKLAWSDPDKAKPMLDRIPLNRFANPNEISEPVCFLLSDYSSMINGITLPIDGGFLATGLPGSYHPQYPAPQQPK